MEINLDHGAGALYKRPNLALWAPLSLVLFWAMWDLCMFRLHDKTSDGPVAGMIAFGPFYGQAVLAALWGAWGPGRSIIRWPVATGLLVVETSCCTLLTDPTEFMQAFFPLAIAFLACFLLLLVGRGVMGWAMHFGDGLGVSSHNGRYGVRYLLGLTTFVALLAGLAKLTDVVGFFESELIVDPSELALIVLVLVLFTTPVALLFIVTLMPGAFWGRRLFVVALICVLAILLITTVVHMRGPGDWVSGLLETAAVLFGAGATVGFSAAMLRWAGYRVGRKQGNSEDEAGGSLQESTQSDARTP